MGTTGILSAAWQIVRRQPLLWLLGFLAALKLNFTPQSGSPAFWQGGGWFLQNLQNWTGLLTPAFAVTLLVSLLFWLLGLLARAALIQMVAELDAQGTRSPFGFYWRRSLSQLGQLLLMQVIVWLPLLLLALASWLWMERTFTPMFENNQTPTGLPPEFPARFAYIWASAMGVGILATLLNFVDAFAYRAIVIEQRTAWAAIRRGLAVLGGNLGSIFTTAVGLAVISFLVSLVIGMISLPFMAIFFLGPMWQNLQTCGGPGVDQAALAACLQQSNDMLNTQLTLTLLSVGSALLSSGLIAYMSTAFTLLYQRLTGIQSHTPSGTTNPYTLLSGPR